MKCPFFSGFWLGLTNGRQQQKMEGRKEWTFWVFIPLAPPLFWCISSSGYVLQLECPLSSSSYWPRRLPPYCLFLGTLASLVSFLNPALISLVTSLKRSSNIPSHYTVSCPAQPSACSTSSLLISVQVLHSEMLPVKPFSCPQLSPLNLLVPFP